MATPLSSSALVKALRAEGVNVVEHPGWRSHNRAGHGPWGPVHGVVIHHTVTTGTAASVDICWDGYNDLPGPLCHGVVDKEGTVHLVGNGRANHAGTGDDDVLRAVIAEDYDEAPPRPNENNTDGNRYFYGFECINLGDGKDPWPTKQLEAIERLSAAICRVHGWTARSVIGHREWTDTKVDPRGFAMPDLRARIARRLSAKPTGKAKANGASDAALVSPVHVPEAAPKDPSTKQGKPASSSPTEQEPPMFTDKAFWLATVERAVRTFAQTLIAALGLDTTDLLDLPWEHGLALAGLATILSVLTSIATAGTGKRGPGITETTTADAPLNP
ncbi:holin [Streptomyces decoyicus]|uniref:holin n=1 Tax=Streptomyces decoyicus TaxID=249567 RepID=UPI0038669094|nr:holin [Streptomyces decoyicus]